MYEFLWLASPLDDDDDDDFAFEEGHAELAAEIREYADGDDDEFDEEERAVLTIAAPLPPIKRPVPAASGRPAVKRAEKPPAAARPAKKAGTDNKKERASKTAVTKKAPPRVPKGTKSRARKVSG